MKKFVSILLMVSLLIGLMCSTVSATLSNFGSSTVYSNNFWGSYVTGQATPLTNEKMKSVEISYLSVKKDVENDFPVMLSENGDGYVILKLEAMKGKVFHNGTISVNGRTPVGSSIKFYAGTTLENVAYDAAGFGDECSTSLTMHIPQNADITPHMKGKSVLYLKVELKGGAGASLPCLQSLKISAEYQNVAELIKYDNFDGYGVGGGQVKDVTAQDLGVYKASNVLIGVVDLGGGNLQRVLRNRGTTPSTIIYKFNAYENKQFLNLYVHFHGRTQDFSGNGTAPAALKYYISDTEETLDNNLYKEYTSQTGAINFGTNQVLDLSEAAKGKSTVYVKVQLNGTGDWIALEKIEFSANYQSADPVVYYKDFKSFVSAPPNSTTVTKEHLGAVEVDNIKGNYMDNNNYYPVIYAPNGNGYFTLKLDADAGKLFETLSLYYKGRAITVDSSVCTLKFYVGDTKENITTEVKTYIGNYSTLDKMSVLDLTNYAKDKPYIYLKIELYCPTGFNWACLSYFEAVGKSYSDSLCSPYITDESNRPISDLQIAQNNVIIGVKLRPTTTDTGLLIGTLYNKESGKIEEVKTFKPQTIVDGQITEYKLYYDLTGKDKSKYKLKAMVWDNFGSMLPICDYAVTN